MKAWLSLLIICFIAQAKAITEQEALDQLDKNIDADVFHHGLTILQKYAQGDHDLRALIEDIGSMIKLAASAVKAFLTPGISINASWYPNSDPHCIPYEEHYFRTIDGSCNWIEKDHWTLGAKNQPFGRDRPPAFADGVSKPRQGPNPRLVSNAFFDNEGGKRTKDWKHTPFLIGYVEFLVHDLVFSMSQHGPGGQYDIPVPKGDAWFDPEGTGNVKLPFWRTKPADIPGPRVSENGISLWMDLGMIYGDTVETNRKLRTGENGKLKMDSEGLLPTNTEEFKLPLWYSNDPTDVFVAGEPRANQDFILQSWLILFAREHNRICEELLDRYPKGLENHPWTDELLFKTARTVNAAKFSMVGNAYFIAYFLASMPQPATPFNIYNMYKGISFTSPIQSYPWSGTLNADGRPDPLPEEFSVEYRWHDLLPDHLTDTFNNKKYDLVNTSWSAKHFKAIGFETILKAMTTTSIPDFHGGVHDGYRNAKFSFRDPNEGHFFDLAAFAIEHERERGIPAFNDWARGYDGAVPVKPRETFEEFTTNPKFLAALKKLYKTPDEVDLYVGQELDETWWPHTHIPTAALAASFYTLFKGGVVDRFALLYQLSACLKEQKPWNCKPTNVLQELLWRPVLRGKMRWLDNYWLKEFDILNQGNDILRQIISLNTDLKCLPRNAFFLEYDKNPIYCWNITEVPGPEMKTSNNLLNSVKMATSYGEYKLYREYRHKYGNVLRISLKTEDPQPKNILFLSRINDFKSIWGPANEPKFLARDWTPYIFETYGRIAGRPEGWGYGISNSAGAAWRHKRWIHNKYVIPTFAKNLPLINAYARQLVAKLSEKGGKDGKKKVEPWPIINENYKQIMSDLAYGKQFLDADPTRRKKLSDAIQDWLDGWSSLVHGWLDTRDRNGKMDYVNKLSIDALKDPKQEESWLRIFSTSKSEDGTYMDKGDAMASAFDLIGGNCGSGTFALTWIIWMLGKTPDVLEKLAVEVSDVLGKDGDVDESNIHNMPYLRKVVMEGLRHFPHGGHIGGGRRNTEPAVVETYQIPVNTTILTNAYWIQTSPRYWGENPIAFDPERFEKKRPDPDYALPIFGFGEMACAGKDLAMLQLTVNIAHVARGLALKPADKIVPNIDWVTDNLKMSAFEIFKHPVKFYAPKRQWKGDKEL